jgi:hypothetical protein
MSKSYLCNTPLPLEQEVDIGGIVIIQVVGTIRCVQAISRSDNVKRIFLIYHDHVNESAWKWSGDVETFDEATVSLDPDFETRWEPV